MSSKKAQFSVAMNSNNSNPESHKTASWRSPEISLHVDDPILDIRATEHQVGLKKSAIYRMVSEGTFPPPINLGRKNGWLLSQLNLWKRERIAATMNEKGAA